MNTELIIFPEPVPYADALKFQDERVALRQNDQVADTLIILEHTPVITMGIRAKSAHLLLTPELLAARGIALSETPRGGDVTYHAPGQLVLYPILKLEGEEADAHAFVGKLEDIAIRTAQAFKVDAFRRKGKTGVWTSKGKVAAIGVRFKKWVSSHGMSFNVNVDLAGFNTIIPCGLHGEKVTSLQALLGERCPGLPEVQQVMARQFELVMGRVLIPGSDHHRK